MKKLILILAVALSGLFVAGQVWAGPAGGFGIGGSLVTHTFKVAADPAIGSPAFEIETGGAGPAADWMIVLSDSFTLSPFAQISVEEGDDVIINGQTLSSEFTVFVLGVQARFWFDQFFVGGLIAHFTVDSTIDFGGFSTDDSESAIGFGGVAGWEGDNGVFAYGQYEIFDLDDVDVTGLRAVVGFRFRM